MRHINMRKSLSWVLYISMTLSHYKPMLKQSQLQNDGQGIRSFTSESIELLERQSGRELDADEEFLVKWAGASVYAGE